MGAMYSSLLDLAYLSEAVGSELKIPINGSLTVCSGWVGYAMDHKGAERTIGLLLPGDRIDASLFPEGCRAIAMTRVLLTPAEIGPARDPNEWVKHLMRHCFRGQLPAGDRLEDFLMETYERLKSAGLAAHGKLEVPITYRQLSSLLGMSEIHLCRRFKDLRSKRRIVKNHKSILICQLADSEPVAASPSAPQTSPIMQMPPQHPKPAAATHIARA